MSKKIGFVSLGCAKNLTDTETMIGILSGGGYEITADASTAEIIVVNTCAFIDSAKEESINTILEMAKYKEKHCELLIVTGCMAQRYQSEIASQLPEVDILLGTADYGKIMEAIDAFYQNGEKERIVSDANSFVRYDLPRVRTTPDYTAYIKIADGCDNFCTYCIIPKLRGKFRSRPSESILAEARKMVKDGVKELILVAQDTACYGKDLPGETLPNLLKELSEIEGIEWIRLQYCYPENITEELIEAIATIPKVVKYLDMPLQHISDDVLKAMGRRSRQAEIETLIEKLRARIPDVTLRTSLIVGFPGETEKDFNKLKVFLEKYRIDKLGVFSYSQEEGTPAAGYDNQVDDVLKEQRRDEIMTLQQTISSQINQAKIGTECTVLIEGYDETELCYVGRCEGDTDEVDGNAYLYSQEELHAGDIVRMKILDAREYDVIGEMLYEPCK